MLGSSRALELLYFSEAVTASRAQELGLVTEVVADADVRGRVMHLAHRLADAPPEALRAMKQHVVRAAGGDCAAGLADCADAEAEWHARLIGGSEHRGAVRALMNRLSAPHESGDANRDQS
jgi:2-(1,2-epoxy-1,2-dihydrophenyl)acetyl-CoA isomerase